MKIEDHRLLNDQGAPVPFRSSPNHGGALAARYLVMHFTAGRSAESSAGWLCDPRAKASAHVVVGADGSVIQLVPFDVVAWHAGASTWTDDGVQLVGMNKYSIGIELDNPGRLVHAGEGWRSLELGAEYPAAEGIEATHKNETRPSGWHIYPQVQLEVAMEVALLLFQAYELKDVVGHDDIAPGRKCDPGPAFPMDSFRGRLLGRADDGPAVMPAQFITATALNIRRGPGTQHPPILPSPLPAGTRVGVMAADGDWRQVDVLDAIGGVADLHGWVNGRYLTPTTATA